MEQQINDIMRNFNFDEVEQHMLKTQWKWGHGEAASVPSVQGLMAMAEGLLRQAANSPMEATEVACGGFHALKFPWGLSLLFAIENWDAENT